eukprot:13683-Heterococcus_DN1.PRE.1
MPVLSSIAARSNYEQRSDSSRLPVVLLALASAPAATVAAQQQRKFAHTHVRTAWTSTLASNAKQSLLPVRTVASGYPVLPSNVCVVSHY